MNDVSRLSHLGLIRFGGADAATFLQGQLSNDTRRLLAGQVLRAALSTPQGRVLTVLTLLPHSSGILALLPREILAPTIEGLRRYVLRAKVKIEDVSDQFLVLGHSVGPGVAPGTARYTEIDGVGSAPVVADAGRCWIVGPAEALEARAATSHEAADLAWRLADIRAGLPQIYAATRELFVAQMLNLDLIDGISFTKGCFTGQEIIARTQHLGRIKRRSFRLRLPSGSWVIGQGLRLADGRVGRLTDVIAVEDGHEALAVLPLEASAGDAAAGETAEPAVDAVMLPMPYDWQPAA